MSSVKAKIMAAKAKPALNSSKAKAEFAAHMKKGQSKAKIGLHARHRVGG